MEATYTLTTPSHPGLIIRSNGKGFYIECPPVPKADQDIAQTVFQAIMDGTVAQLTLPDGYRLVKHLSQ